MTQHFTSTEWFKHKNPTPDGDPLNTSITTNYTPIQNMERHKKAKADNWDGEHPKESVIPTGIVKPKDTEEQLSPRTKKIIVEAEPLHKRFDEKKKAAAEKEKAQELKRLKIERKKKATAEDKKKPAGEDQKKKKAATEAEKKKLTVKTELPHKPLTRIATDSSLATTVDTPSRSRVKNLFRSSKRLFFILCLCLLVGANVNLELFILSVFLLLLFFLIDICVYFYTCYTGKEAAQWMWLTDLFNAYVLVALYYLFAGRKN
jgi:hypothetical protein